MIILFLPLNSERMSQVASTAFEKPAYKVKYKNEPYSTALHHRLVSQSGVRVYDSVRGCGMDNPHQSPSEQGGRAETEVVAFNCITPNPFWNHVNRY